MELEELKLEAEKLGYKLIKKPEKLNALRCTCGCKPHEWYRVGSGDDDDDSGNFYICPNCGLKSEAVKTHIGAKRAWNRMIEEELKHLDDEKEAEL